MFGPETSNLVFTVSAAIDVIVVCGAVWWATGKPPVGWRLAGALASALGVMAVKGVLLMAAGIDRPFGVAHVLWLDLVVVLPLAGLVLLVRARGWVLRAVAIGALLFAPVGAYASFVEPSRLELEQASARLPAERAGERPLRVGVMADLQFEFLGDHEREAAAKLMAQRPDVILLAGDFHQGRLASLESEMPELHSLLSSLHAPGGVYAVQGDQESLETMRWTVRGTGVRLLTNDVVRTRVGDRRVSIAGVPLPFWTERTRRFVRAFEEAPGDRDVRLLVAHRPDVVYSLQPDTRVDLVAAGHTHGGQIDLPLVGPLSVASQVPRDVGAGGLHVLDGRRLYVTRGVGVERGQAPRVRLGDPPEVSVVTLR